MALVEYALPLDPGEDDGPTLSGGALYSAAVGSLPARLHRTLDVITDEEVLAGTSGPGGWHFASDDTILSYHRANSRLRTISPVTGQRTAEYTVSTISGVPQYADGYWWGVSYGSAKVYKIDPTTFTVVEGWTGTVANPMRLWKVPGSNLVWVSGAGNAALFTEYDITPSAGAVAATGRTISGNNFQGIVGDADGSGFYTSSQSAPGKVHRWKQSDATAEWTYTPPYTTNRNDPGNVLSSAGSYRGLTLYGAHLYVAVQYLGAVDQFLASDGSFVKRFLHPGSGLGGVADLGYSQNSFAIAPSGNYAAWAEWGPTDSGYATRLRIQKLGTARAEWTLASSGASRTLRAICVPGHLAGAIARVEFPLSTTTEYDYRRARTYYQIGAGSWTEFTPGARLDVSVPGGSTVGVRVDMLEGIGKPWATEPFVGAVELSEPSQVTVFMDDGSALNAGGSAFNRGFN